MADVSSAIAGATAQQRAQIVAARGEQAQVQLTFGGQACTVAGMAERLRHADAQVAQRSLARVVQHTAGQHRCCIAQSAIADLALVEQGDDAFSHSPILPYLSQASE